MRSLRESSHLRRLVAVLTGLALVSGACSTRSVSRSTASLTIRITELPAGAAGNVLVTGPGGYRVQLSRTSTLQAPTGQYLVTAAGVPVGTDTYYAQHVVMRVRAPGTLVVGYAEQVPDTTKVLDGADLGLLPGTSATGATIAFLPGTPAARLRAGDVAVVSAGPDTPHGLLRKIVSVAAEANQVLVDVVPAGLRDAMPQGAFSVRLPVDPTATVGFGTTPCGSGANLAGSATASVDGYVDFDMAWGFVTPNYIKLVGGVSENGGASLKVQIQGTCKVSADSEGLPLPVIPIDVGPLVLEVTPMLVAHGEASGTFTAGPQYGFRESGWAKAGFTWGTPDGSNQDLHPIFGVGASFIATPPNESPQETLWAGAGPQVNFDIDGLDGGPFVNFLGGINVTNTQNTDGRYHFAVASAGKVNVGIRAHWGPLNFSLSQPFTLPGKTLFQRDYQVLTTAPSTPSTTTTSAGPAAHATVVKTFEPWTTAGQNGGSDPLPGLVVTNGGPADCDSGSADDPGSALAVRCSPPGNGTPCFINDTGGGDPGGAMLCTSDPTSMAVTEVTPSNPNGIPPSRLNHADPSQPAWFLLLADGRRCSFQGYGTNTDVLSYDCGNNVGATTPDRSQPAWTVREGIEQMNPRPSSTQVTVVTAYR